MLLVSMNRVKPGMVTASPVLHPRRSATRLVQDGVPLTDDLIHRMTELHVPHIWVKHPLLKDLDGLILSRVPECRRAIYGAIRDGFDSLQNRVITTSDYHRYRQVISDLMTELIGRNTRAGELAERLFSDGDELVDHCSNVAYLAVTVGMHLETYIARQRERASGSEARDLTSLGVGAILHDLGKLQMPEELRGQHELVGDHHAQYREHAQQGFHMLRQRINPVASTIALHHHQRWDGAGWPDMTDLTYGRHTGGLNGQRIHIFARIVAVANALDELMVSVPKRRPAAFALHTLQSPRFAGAFDPIVLDAFLRNVPPFPTGAQVVLSDGRTAAVTELNGDCPCRPKVRPLEDESDGSDIDLSGQTKLFVVEAQGEDVTAWLYDLPPRAQVHAAAAEQSIII